MNKWDRQIPRNFRGLKRLRRLSTNPDKCPNCGHNRLSACTCMLNVSTADGKTILHHLTALVSRA